MEKVKSGGGEDGPSVVGGVSGHEGGGKEGVAGGVKGGD